MHPDVHQCIYTDMYHLHIASYEIHMQLHYYSILIVHWLCVAGFRNIINLNNWLASYYSAHSYILIFSAFPFIAICLVARGVKANFPK